MARRKRLAPLPDPAAARAPEVKSVMPPPGLSRPPIAQVAGEASSVAAFDELARELTDARETGRMVLDLPLEQVDEAHLVRDRVVNDAEDMEALLASLRERGQQTPIEVVALEGGQYGLISGWRRLMALRQLHAEGQGPDKIKALLRKPDTAAEAYRAMVEENEIRVGLSYYERARIVARATEAEVYPDEVEALKGLFGSASRAKRSKIGKFVRIYHALDAVLGFPGAIPERLGLKLAARIEADADFATRLRDRLRKTPSGTAEDEAAALEKALSEKDRKQDLDGGLETISGAKPDKKSAPSRGSVQLVRGNASNTLVLRGPGVTPAFQQELADWLLSRES